MTPAQRQICLPREDGNVSPKILYFVILRCHPIALCRGMSAICAIPLSSSVSPPENLPKPLQSKRQDQRSGYFRVNSVL